MGSYRFAPALLAVCAAVMGAGGAWAETPPRVSAPLTHNNLAVYLIHGASAPGPVPLTIQEAMSAGRLTVHETGDVNNLAVENTGDAEVFIQAGEIVKGGKQDRVLTVSLTLPPNSGRIPIAAFCVEHGRWTPRAGESAAKFDTSTASLPSHAAKLAMLAPAPTKPEPTAPDVSNVMRQGYPVTGMARQDRSLSDNGSRQNRVWDSVAEAQRKLSKNLETAVAAPQSATSLQLTLENKKLGEARDAYVKALKTSVGSTPDAIGYVVAINGKIMSGDTFASHALFAKLWPKLLEAAATEAIAEKDGQQQPAPTEEAVLAFLARSDDGKIGPAMAASTITRTTRETDDSYMVETKTKAGTTIHRAYLAR